MRSRYTTRKEWTNELPPFDPNKNYDERELELYSDLFLRKHQADFDGLEPAKYPSDGKAGTRHPILFQEHIEPRWRKEVNTVVGTPEQAISDSTSADGQRMFNRTHPQGRKTNSEKQRRVNGASYYRG